GEVAFEAAWVQVAVEGSDQEKGVEVCGDDLFVDLLSGGLARKPVLAFEDRRDYGELASGRPVQHDPVADGGEIGPAARLVSEPAADFGRPFPFLGVVVIQFAVLDA